MTLTDEFIEGLVQSVATYAKVRSWKPYFKIVGESTDFQPDGNSLYYGVFNIGKDGSLVYSLLGSAEIEITLAVQDNAFTQPVCFDAITATNVSFMGVKIDIDKTSG